MGARSNARGRGTQDRRHHRDRFYRWSKEGPTEIPLDSPGRYTSGCPQDPDRTRTDHCVQKPITARVPCLAGNAMAVSDAPTAESETCKEIPCCTDIPEGDTGMVGPATAVSRNLSNDARRPDDHDAVDP